jgi:hypothetical protein
MPTARLCLAAQQAMGFEPLHSPYDARSGRFCCSTFVITREPPALLNGCSLALKFCYASLAEEPSPFDGVIRPF